MDLKEKRVLVLGLGESGLACTLWCLRQGARVRVADTRTAPPYLAELNRRLASADFRPEFVAGEFNTTLLDDIDLLVLSPGLSAGLELVRQARARKLPVVGEIELFAWGLRRIHGESPVPVLAITGTNGKTTTTALAGQLLRGIGQRVGVAGNISPAALTALMDAEDARALPQVWVLELSSFQLETTYTLNPAAATVLNISDDHLDRYADVEDYARSKTAIFQSAADAPGVQVLNRDDARVRRMALAGRRVISFGLDAPPAADDFGIRVDQGQPWLAQGERFLLPVAELPLAGLHNATNAMAALALCAALGFDANTLLPALRSFRGLPHRVEKVAEIAGVTWYDDSKGTNVGATVAALSGLAGVSDRKSVVILGGDGKAQDFSPLGDAVARHARAVVLIGRDGPAIGQAIAAAGVRVESAADMDDAVRCVAALARPGDAALLSPACASFDMFRNYEHRAQVFVAAVKALGGGQ
ncbi:MAG: UDP-N-acetylmuramoyl-L-alanine--D-glutamate ligase [Rhodocyclales bacterium]|nr:UDP-N-acetylmuramoyl-L-alanine--D-glutamate ligase [Rhodocyclales bacterium]